MLGDTYTIVDMNVWGWARLMPNMLGEGAWAKFTNLKRLVDEISARPAAQKALTLKDRHKFKTEMDQEVAPRHVPAPEGKGGVERSHARAHRTSSLRDAAARRVLLRLGSSG